MSPELKKTLWLWVSVAAGLAGGVMCLPIGVFVAAIAFTQATHGVEPGLGWGMIVGWYGLLLGTALGIPVTVFLARWIYRRKVISN